MTVHRKWNACVGGGLRTDKSVGEVRDYPHPGGHLNDPGCPDIVVFDRVQKSYDGETLVVRTSI